MHESETFPPILRQYRRAADLTQEQLAELTGCSVATLRAFESGRRRPSRDLAERLADVLQIPAAFRERFIRLARVAAPAVDEPPEVPARIPELQPAVQVARFRVPAATAQLIGRRQERSQIIEHLTEAGARLVTILGPGGIGKTRLALQVGGDLEEYFAAGTAFVALGPVASVEHVPSAIADALGCRLNNATPPEQDLIAFLRDQELLLLLDNLEHLLIGEQGERLTGLLNTLITQAPQIRILTTSRERLRMRDEWVVEIDGLGLPSTAGRKAIEQSDAVLLFVERARQVGSDFALTPENRQAVAELCKALDGMPLGIELAAAWVNVLSCHEIAQEISRNQELLTSNARDIPLRHRSLRAVFEHSWRLLNADERRTLRRLSVFHGRFSREAATAVMHDPGAAGRSAVSVLPLMASLVDKSLLRIRSDNEGQSAYDMHELIRQYAGAHLAEDADEHRLTRQLHAAYYAAWTEQQDAALKSVTQRTTLIAMNRVIDNLRAAWQWAVDHQASELLLHMVYTMGWFYEIQGRNREYVQLLSRGSNALREKANHPAAAKRDQVAYWVMISLEGWASARFDPLRAVQLFQTALPHLRSLGDDKALFQGLITPSYVAIFGGDQDQARALLAETISAAERANYFWGVATAYAVLGVLEVLYSDAATAQRQLMTSLRIAKESGDPRHIALMLNYSGLIALELNDLETAEAYCREALSIGMTQRDRYQIGLGMLHLGQIALARKDQAAADWLFQEVLSIAHEISDHWLEAQALGAQGQLAMARGEQQTALSLLRQGLQVSIAAPIVFGLDLLPALAELAAASHPTAALTVLHYVAMHPLARPATRERATAQFERGANSNDPALVEAAIQQAAARSGDHPSSLHDLFPID